MTFFYNMYGADVGELRVEIKESDNTSTLWRKQGDQGVGWHSANVPISSHDTFWVTAKNKDYYIHSITIYVILSC